MQDPAQLQSQPRQQPQQQSIPVRMYRSEDRLMVAAPMAGVAPEDIQVEITPQNHLRLHGAVRGVLQDHRDLLLAEWTIGDYQRDLELPMPVNGNETNVTYGNGVVVVVLPVAAQTTPAHLRMESIYDDKGERVGNAGHPPHAMTTAQHEANLVNEWLLHGGNPRAVADQGQSRPGTGQHG